MKLDVWQRAMDMFDMAYRLTASVSDFKLESKRGTNEWQDSLPRSPQSTNPIIHSSTNL